MPQERKDIENLPSSDTKFWEFAEVDKTEIIVQPDCEHYFKHRSGVEIECIKCHVGYVLSPGWYLDSGKLVAP